MWESIFPFAFIGIFLMVYFYYNRKYKHFEAIFRNQAGKRDGKVTLKSEWLWKIPRLYLYDKNNEISISPFKRRGHSDSSSVCYMYAECFIKTTRDYKVSVTPEHTLKKVAKIFGMQDIQLNNPDFDKSFQIKGDDEFLIQRLLTPDVQSSLLSIKDLEPSVRIENKEFECSVYKHMGNDDEFDLFLNAVMALIISANKL